MGYSIFDETMVDMAWPDIEKAAQGHAVVLMPTGVIEEHGPHMDLAVDTYCSYLTCKQTRRELEKRGIKTLIAPPYYWGLNNATGSFPGSFTVRKSTMKAMLIDILTSLMRWGFSRVFNINWHGEHEHNMTILEAVKEARFETGLRAYCVLSAYDAVRLNLSGREPHVLVQNAPRFEKPPTEYLEIHADSLETGIMAKFFPRQIDIEMARTLKSTDLTLEDLMIWRKGWSDSREVTPLGYFGNPAEFDIDAADKYIGILSIENAEVIQSLIEGRYVPPELNRGGRGEK